MLRNVHHHFCIFATMFIKLLNKAVLISFVLLLASCREDEAKRLEAQAKEEVRKDEVFKQIQEAWLFKLPVLGSKEQSLIGDWAQWRILTTEIRQKPTTSIEAFQTKAKTFSLKIKELNASVPSKLNIPEFKSRLLVLQTKMNVLDLYISLNPIPVDKVKITIEEINEQFLAIQNQLTEIVLRSEIPLEEGELETIQQLRDTTRMVKNKIQNTADFE
jgi:hypothetical protein